MNSSTVYEMRPWCYLQYQPELFYVLYLPFKVHDIVFFNINVTRSKFYDLNTIYIAYHQNEFYFRVKLCYVSDSLVAQCSVLLS